MTSTLDRDQVLAVGDTISLAIDPVSRTTVALFAGGSGDHNPIHLDLDVAHGAGLDDVFAQGMLSMAFLGRLLTDNFPQSAIHSFSSRFVAITPIYAVPACQATVVSIEADLLTLDLTVTLGDGTVTLAGQATIHQEGNTQ